MKKEEILGGTIRKEDANELKQSLQEHKAVGNRFLAFESGQTALTKDHFVGFKSAFAAMEFAYENTTDRDRYIVRSVPVVEKEIDKILGPGKEQALENHSGKVIGNEKGYKRSPSQELSR